MTSNNNLNTYIQAMREALKKAPTPGPWDWYWRTNDGKTDCGVFSMDGGISASVCRAPRYQTKEQWEADAALIAACHPDAIRTLLESYDSLATAYGRLVDERLGDISG
jgi:hypothetical protein